ncbi:MAG: restriction endonuclease [Candidatus Altiarchaeota archaeon]
MTHSAANSQWEQFEQAVAAFIRALTPNAVVTHSPRLPDKHTGQPRQRDVWVEAIVGIFPVKILISCKRLKRRINEQDMDAFVGELLSSGAHKGVVYAFSGFTAPAITKAKTLGISCCKLYQNSPAELPDSLMFVFYCCGQSWRLRLNGEAFDHWGTTSFDEVFSIRNQSGDPRTVLEMLLASFTEEEERVVRDATGIGRFPEDWTASLEIRTGSNDVAPLRISLDGKWKVYRAKLEAHLLDGTYSFTENLFAGSQTSPWIDTQGPDPGPGWELITDPPTRLQPGVGMFILKGGKIKEGLIEHFASKKLSELR